MKTTALTIALLLGLVTGSAWAQSNGAKPKDKAGSVPLLPNMTVLQALASAGFSQFANTKGIYVLRVENGRQQKIPVNYKQLVKGEAMGQNILMKPGDTIVVP